MTGVTPERQSLRLSGGGGNGKTSALTSLVGISGQMHGVVVLSFPLNTALGLAGRMLGSEPREINGEVVDAVSELVNMVAGSAKAKFQCDPPLDLGLPTVVEGSEYRVKYPSRSTWLEVPFSSDAGDFSMEVTFSSDKG